MRNRWTALAIGAVLVGGCIQYNSLVDIKGATLALSPAITEGKYTTQATQVRYTKSTINHLVLDIYEMPGETLMATASKDVANADLDAAIYFIKLTANQAYRIKAYAYKAPGTASVDLISENSSSSTDVQMPAGGGIATASFKVWLKDTTFDSQATESWDITNGGILQPPPETVN